MAYLSSSEAIFYAKLVSLISHFMDKQIELVVLTFLNYAVQGYGTLGS